MNPLGRWLIQRKEKKMKAEAAVAIDALALLHEFTCEAWAEWLAYSIESKASGQIK